MSGVLPFVYVPPVATANPFLTMTTPATSLRTGWTDWIGMYFNPRSSMTITALGRWIAAGNTLSITLGLFDIANVQQRSAVLDPTLTAPGQFGYATLATPIVLPANSEWYCGFLPPSQNVSEAWLDLGSTFSWTADVASVVAAYWDSDFLSWQVTGSSGNAYGIPNFLYTVP